MNNRLEDILNKVKNGDLTVEDAKKRIKGLTYTDLGYAKVDHHRGMRNGAGEVIYAKSKTSEQIIGIVENMKSQGEENILITRLSMENYNKVSKKIQLKYDEVSEIAVVGDNNPPSGHGYILVATAGTSDISVAEEAAKTAEFLGNKVVRAYDVGVAGLHRLLDRQEEIANASVVIAIAGMEGALASVIGGLADCPVIAVPTSVGYGASFGGVSALLSMLNSCASGVSVVNIDNGFGAGFLASRINHMEGKEA